jgi:dephospho-CoA kinase
MSPLAVGITGGIGGGKTQAARIFKKLGATVLFADRIASELIDSREEIRERIQHALGRSALFPDGRLNRKKVAELVFSDHHLRRKLDSIVHPFVLRSIRERIAHFKAQARSPLIMVEAALLFEARAISMFDYVIVVDAPEDVRMRRVMGRDGSARPEVLRRIKAQLPAEHKTARADFVIYNGGDLAVLEKNCRFLHRILIELASHPPTP